MLASHHRVGRGVGVLVAMLTLALAACGSSSTPSGSSSKSPLLIGVIAPFTGAGRSARPGILRRVPAGGASHQQRGRCHGAHGELQGV